ncbi:Rieske 2Fe-2S domain-containing protein [Spongiibacter sp. KMU-158]|uniref:Rieske 2Fe-2S domain-containing protein n=1 Tax=Spongiibacter pelagi TaxID=2760804 RepID=A0A927GWX1_9GAMM|nr:Rieske 2Fe-2S domain-containing protein [Spongiibacter pelagi]MBD2858844.1 Rieske 2Fe-2S domain-containing protein [Spongiibacter pelagi]
MTTRIKLCNLDELPEPGSKSVTLGEQACFLVRHGKGVALYQNRCPHLGIELNWQEDVFLDHEEMFIQCATHGALFIMETGECVAGPCLGEALTSIPCTIEEDGIYA